MAEFTFEITEELGELGENGRGWKKELNLVSFSGREPKYDIREWNPDHTRIGKGVTLTLDEIINLKNILQDLDLEGEDDDIDPREQDFEEL